MKTELAIAVILKILLIEVVKVLEELVVTLTVPLQVLVLVCALKGIIL